MVLPLTVSLRPPAITTPLPTGPASAEPVVGTFGLLLSCTEFLVKSQQECVPVGPVPPFGQAPSCGEGASSLFWLLVTKPDWLLSNSEFWMTRCPPELVPEYPRSLFWAWAWSRIVLQSGQAPM